MPTAQPPPALRVTLGSRMIHPIPSGTRDVLPDETREAARDHRRPARASSSATATARSTRPRSSTSRCSAARATGRSAARLPRVRRDRRGAGAALGHDRADRARRRDAATPTAEPPLRFCYFAHCYRGVAPAARPAARAAAGRHRADRLARAGGDRRGAHGALPRARRHRPEGLPRRPRRRLAVPGADGEPAGARGRRATACCEALVHARLRRARAAARRVRHRRRGRRAAARASRSGAAAPSCSPRRPAEAAEAVTGLRQVHELLEPDVAARVIFDLGLVRNIGYYTGAVFEVYDPALGAPIGGGGRYDDLLGRFGRAPARRRLRARRRPPAPRARRRGARHRRAAARSDGSRGAEPADGREPRVSAIGGLTIAVPRGALFDGHRRAARRARASTPTSCARTTASCCSRTSA